MPEKPSYTSLPFTMHKTLPDVACSWCGRAIRPVGSGPLWEAVKGRERGYDPLACDANTDDGRHEP